MTLNWPTGVQPTRSLPRLEIANGRGGADVMWLDGLHRLSLYPAPEKRPQPADPNPPGLVQPPKKPGK